MKPLDGWRGELRGLIPRGFLRRDQGIEAVFISDYPRLADERAVTRRLTDAGYRVQISGSLAHIDGTEEKYLSLLSALPCPSPPPRDDTLYHWSLAQRLLRAQTPLESQPLPLLGQWMKRLEAGDEGAIRDIAAYAARCQREGMPLPAAAGKLILCFLSDLQGGITPC